MRQGRTGRAFIKTAGARMVASQLRGRMDDSAQQRLFAETPGSIEPPEEDLYLGTSGWSYADWEGTLYPEALPSASRLRPKASCVRWQSWETGLARSFFSFRHPSTSRA